MNMGLLKNARPPREYAIALAHCIVAAKPGTERAAMLNEAFRTELSPMQKLACRAEIRACQQAKRGELAELRAFGPTLPTHHMDGAA
jgi:hypothetical protein